MEDYTQKAQVGSNDIAPIPALPLVAAEPQPDVDQRINAIADQVFTGIRLSQADKAFLADVREGSSVTDRKILWLARKLFKYPGKLAAYHERVSEAVSGRQIGSTEAQAMAAHLLLVYDDAKDQNIGALIKDLAGEQQKRPLTDDNLKQIVRRYNSTIPPQHGSAGRMVLAIADRFLSYDAAGHLKIGVINRKVVSQIVLMKCNEKLNDEKIRKIEGLHDKFTRTPFNTAGPMLEFMSFVRDMRRINTRLTLKDAAQSLDLRPEAIHDKYRSGNCVIVSTALRRELKQQLDIEAAVIGQYTGAEAARPPVPDPRGDFGVWKDYDQATENVHHCNTLVRYSNSKSEEKVKILDISFQDKDEPVDYDSWSKWLKEVGNYDTNADIQNPGHILKMQMFGKTKLVIKGCDAEGQILGVDLLNGNIYLSSLGADKLAGLPLNNDRRFSMSLGNLRDLSEKGVYYINDELTQITHGDALKCFVQAASKRFQLPDDFADNLLTLAENEEDLINTVLFPTIKVAREVHRPAVEVYKMLQHHEKTWQGYKMALLKLEPGPLYDAMTNYSSKIREMRTCFNQMQQAIIDLQPVVARQSIEEIKRINDELVALAVQIDAPPDDIN